MSRYSTDDLFFFICQLLRFLFFKKLTCYDNVYLLVFTAELLAVYSGIIFALCQFHCRYVATLTVNILLIIKVSGRLVLVKYQLLDKSKFLFVATLAL